MLWSYEINCSPTQSDTAIKLLVWNNKIKKMIKKSYKRVKKKKKKQQCNKQQDWSEMQ